MYSWQLIAFCWNNMHVVLVFFLSHLVGFCKESKELKSVFHSAVWTQFWGRIFVQALVSVASNSRMRQYSNTNVSYFSLMSQSKKKHRTLDACRLEYLKTSRVHKYLNMNTFHTLQQSHVPVEHYRTLDVCRLEYLKTSCVCQYSNMNTLH